MKKKLTTVAAAIAMSMASTACTTMGPMDNDVAYIGGAAMYANKNIVENAINSPIHTTLVAAVTQAQLANTLSGPGPFTVFAPTDEAFGKVPKAMLDAAMQDANRPLLQKVLTYHVVPGRVTAADLVQRIKAGGGKTMVATVAGEQLTFSMMGDQVMIMGKNGSMAHVTQADVMQSNGIIHVVDGVLTPSM